ncbi:alpha/beta hydrolase [Streptomyces sp. A1499]|uniref:alpha/beta hydrolase n=1 Tax=Streptomyces sp. A1499 TaxID=2563104 RepID=UPI00144AA70E|nr:alpha/beta hydrolase [Streptomyces sp. A1499]
MLVPLDYGRPDGEKIEISVTRAKATGSRKGSVVLNFGGPGVSGMETLPKLVGSYKALNVNLDLVSFDPRGVGRSMPVSCPSGSAVDALFGEDASPDTAAEAAAYEGVLRKNIQECRQESGKLLPHVGTASTAKDMDALRAALGDEKLNFFGISYGTLLGANYAHQFPERVGRTVLDGAVDPKTSLASKEWSLEQAASFELALSEYAKDCSKTGCGLGSSVSAVKKAVMDIVTAAEVKPLRTKQGPRLNRTLAYNGVISTLYSKDLWPYLTKAVKSAKAGDGSLLMAFAGQQTGKRPDGTYDNSAASRQAINCADTTKRYTSTEVASAFPAFLKASAIFGPSLAGESQLCTGWPYKGEDTYKATSAPGSATPIVVIGNRYDPAAPYAASGRLAQALGHARHVTLNGHGHGAYNTGDPCIQDLVNTYFLDGTVPKDGATCG